MCGGIRYLFDIEASQVSCTQVADYLFGHYMRRSPVPVAAMRARAESCLILAPGHCELKIGEASGKEPIDQHRRPAERIGEPLHLPVESDQKADEVAH